ncbi:hypothetical protein KCP70_00795 [Salmonella enterica subsp. enterica]|nr:hypothetical protein KCP70_00795 [Salmonella enterica subsp. enterica]
MDIRTWRRRSYKISDLRVGRINYFQSTPGAARDLVKTKGMRWPSPVTTTPGVRRCVT